MAMAMSSVVQRGTVGARGVGRRGAQGCGADLSTGERRAEARGAKGRKTRTPSGAPWSWMSAASAPGRTSLALSASKTISDEVMVDQAPKTLLRSGDGSMRKKFEDNIRKGQDDICRAISELDGKEFHEDNWTREDGGGGISRVLSDGNVFEKAGVNVSVVYGSMPVEAYRAATGQADKVSGGEGRVPFFATGISSVMHPRNPFAPTMHFNYRYFETDPWNGLPAQWWFGGGTDITPSYVFEEDMHHFHKTYKDVCDKHDKAFYPKFKKWCDEYFLIKHRKETRGLGGIFFDDLNDRDPDTIYAFSKDCLGKVVDSYVPLVAKHKDDPFTQENKDWQQLRRGRYVEFNLVYDRGTTFGLKTGGRIESILMSLPLTARWEYDHEPEPGSREAELLKYTRNAREWV